MLKQQHSSLLKVDMHSPSLKIKPTFLMKTEKQATPCVPKAGNNESCSQTIFIYLSFG